MTMTKEEHEELGIKAIVYLQSLSGIEETEEQAKIGWNNMTESEQVFTVFLYREFSGG